MYLADLGMFFLPHRNFDSFIFSLFSEYVNLLNSFIEIHEQNKMTRKICPPPVPAITLALNAGDMKYYKR